MKQGAPLFSQLYLKLWMISLCIMVFVSAKIYCVSGLSFPSATVTRMGFFGKIRCFIFSMVVFLSRCPP